MWEPIPKGAFKMPGFPQNNKTKRKVDIGWSTEPWKAGVVIEGGQGCWFAEGVGCKKALLGDRNEEAGVNHGSRSSSVRGWPGTRWVEEGHYRRLNLEKTQRSSYEFKFFISSLGFVIVPGRGDWSPASEAWHVLLFLLCGFEDLRGAKSRLAKQERIGSAGKRARRGAWKSENVRTARAQKTRRTWNEQSRLSSTLIIAPALSNSPQ